MFKELLRGFNQKGYADTATHYSDNKKSGLVLTQTNGEFTYEDEYYGGEPYSGNETIWKNERPIYRVVYWGTSYQKEEVKDNT